MRFKLVTQERYDEMLGAVPPAIMTPHGFLVGEAMTHKGTVPAFTAFVNYIGKCWEAAEPMTIAEFTALGSPHDHQWVMP